MRGQPILSFLHPRGEGQRFTTRGKNISRAGLWQQLTVQALSTPSYALIYLYDFMLKIRCQRIFCPYPEALAGGQSPGPSPRTSGQFLRFTASNLPGTQMAFC